MRDEFLVFGSPLIGEAEIAEVVDSLRSGWVGTGPKVQRFERMLEEYVGTPHVRCVSSCTAALFLAMKVLDIGPGDEVLVPAMTFVATANAVEHTGARPVFVDCEPGTGLIDLGCGRGSRSRRNEGDRARPSVGRPLDMDRAQRLPRPHGLLVVEDAAHAIGARWRGPADRLDREPDRVLVLRDEEHHDHRRGRARHRRPGACCAGRAARPPRAQPRRVAALLGCRVQALRSELRPASSST